MTSMSDHQGVYPVLALLFARTAVRLGEALDVVQGSDGGPGAADQELNSLLARLEAKEPRDRAALIKGVAQEKQNAIVEAAPLLVDLFDAAVRLRLAVDMPQASSERVRKEQEYLREELEWEVSWLEAVDQHLADDFSQLADQSRPSNAPQQVLLLLKRSAYASAYYTFATAYAQACGASRASSNDISASVTQSSSPMVFTRQGVWNGSVHDLARTVADMARYFNRFEAVQYPLIIATNSLTPDRAQILKALRESANNARSQAHACGVPLDRLPYVHKLGFVSNFVSSLKKANGKWTNTRANPEGIRAAVNEGKRRPSSRGGEEHKQVHRQASI